jgi:hypothetical protein
MLVDLVQERFYGCDICRKNSCDWIEDVLRPLRLKKRECRRLFRVLTCPGFNQVGQQAWYLGKDARTAAVEALRNPQPKVPLAIQAFKILDPISALDLRLPIWGQNPTANWILREVVARGFVSERTDEVDEYSPSIPRPTVHSGLGSKTWLSRYSVR